MTNPAERPPVETAAYWQNRYEQGSTGWDIGEPEAVLVDLYRDGHLPAGRMVIPGCGNGWEVTAFQALGFDVTGIDFASAPLQALQARATAEGLSPTLIQADIFELPAHLKGQFDVLLELACFCAIAPEQREVYVAVIDWLLKPDGMVVGLFYTLPDKVGGPPFTVTVDELRRQFSPTFSRLEFTPQANPEETLGIFYKA